MKQLHAVIGANYGDEGKGLITEFLATPGSLVVRYNGGAQAGHTVVTPDGRRHVFHHVGSGALKGAATLLSRFFLVNPMMFVQELRELATKRHESAGWGVYVDPSAPVTTPLDMLFNRAVEQKRGAGRHGSCGVGINETIVRSEAGYALPTWMLEKPLTLRARLDQIVREYVPQRAQELGVTLPPFDWLLVSFLEAVEEFLHFVSVVPDIDVIRRYPHIVFEGAQGLRLDEKSPDFPYVTRSRTGLTNIGTLLQLAECSEVLVAHYVTRAYVTRHGAGPLASETDKHPWGWTGPETNVTNAWQGRLRYGLLEPALLKEALDGDLARHTVPGGVEPQLAVTCLDQIPEGHGDRILKALLDITRYPVTLASMGPTGEDVAACWAADKVPYELG